jgi:pimeloyl-ACP methyl ester carboxylesterase
MCANSATSSVKSIGHQRDLNREYPEQFVAALTKAGYLSAHGGWQGGWAWHMVAPLLRSAGHEVFTPTLRGLDDGEIDRASLTLGDLAGGLTQQIENRNLDDFVLVGHSGGGPVAQLVADRVGHRVRRIVFMSAWVLHDGESILDVHTQPEAEALRANAARSLDNTITMDTERWASTFMQDATPGQLAATTDRLVPTPLGWFDEPIKLPRFSTCTYPRATSSCATTTQHPKSAIGPWQRDWTTR